MLGMLTKWRRAEQALTGKRGETPGFDEVAAVLGLSDSQKLLVANAQQTLSFSPQGNDFAPGSRDQGKSWNTKAACEGRLEADEAHHMLLQCMDRLENRECTILKLRYGLAGEGPLAHKEIGRRLGVAREWVRKIEIRAIRKLRDDHNEQAIESKVRPGLPAQQRIGLPCPARTVRSRRQSAV
jgi:RNA polymerase primary sigma factor